MPDHRLSFLEAIEHGVSEDRMLEPFSSAVAIPEAFYMNIHRMSLPEICFVVSRCLLSDEVDPAALKDMIYSAYDFPLPLKEVSDRLYTFDSTRIPCGTFIEHGAIFSAKLISYLRNVRNDKRNVTALIPADRDSGPILARMFSRIPSLRAVFIFAQNTLDRSLAASLLSVNQNISTLEISGDRESCHSLIADAVCDKDLTNRFFLSAVTPSNPAILLTRVFQFFHGFSQFVSLQKSKNLVGRSIFENGLVFLIPTTMEPTVNAAALAEFLGIPNTKYVFYQKERPDNLSNFLMKGEYGILIPGVQTTLPEPHLRHLPPVDRIPATYPAFKRYISNIINQ